MTDTAEESAIHIRGVSKRFKLYHDLITGPVKEYLYFWKRESFFEEFWTVRDVSFEVKRGEVVGIVGPNGAGKTTLLKMVASLLPVDRGTIEVKGRITALLALGVGVQPEFTGRENIYYGCILLGMPKQEISERMPQIIEFTELGDYIDRPFRTYSAGMRARLLFATAMSVNPDILIVDEALATGDAYFVQKCSKRIHELCNSGATILFVSHNLSQIEELCDRALFMAKGEMLADGQPNEIIRTYNRWLFHEEQAQVEAAESPLIMSRGSGEVSLMDVSLQKDNGEESAGFYTGDEMTILLSYERPGSVEEVDLFIGICESSSNTFVGEILSAIPGERFHGRATLSRSGVIRIRVPELLLLTGNFSLWIMGYHDQEVVFEYRNVGHFVCSRRTNSVIRDAHFCQPSEIIPTS